MKLIDHFGMGGKAVTKYEKAVGKGDGKKALRKFEEGVLTPEKIQPYGGPPPAPDDLERRSVLVVFPDVEGLNIFRRHFKVSEKACGRSVYQINLLVELLKLVESGELVYKDGTVSVAGPEKKKGVRRARR